MWPFDRIVHTREEKEILDFARGALKNGVLCSERRITASIPDGRLHIRPQSSYHAGSWMYHLRLEVQVTRAGMREHDVKTFQVNKRTWQRFQDIVNASESATQVEYDKREKENLLASNKKFLLLLRGD